MHYDLPSTNPALHMAANKRGGSSAARGADHAKPLGHNPFVALVREVKPDVDRRLDAVLAAQVEQHESTGPEVVAMLTEAKALCSRGGKRLRAALIVAGQKALERGRPGRWDRALECGVAVELLQAYFLIHDDWMDRDDTRRGGPAVHAALSRRFRSEHQGACGAILAGDYLVALASRHLTQTLRKHPCLGAASQCFADMQLAAVVGQQLDVIGQSRKAELVYELKTSSYTVTGPLQLGALLAGAKPSALRGLERFARPLGVAFQLRDDLLGAFGRPEVTGKPRGSDIAAGKWTWLVEHALAHGRPKQTRVLERALGKHDPSAQLLLDATAALEDSGARAACEARISELVTRSSRELDRLKLSERGHALLQGAIVALSERHS